MHRNTWKSGERRIAKIFGTVRTPLSGGNSRHTMSDSLHTELFIEVKHRLNFPQQKLWEQTQKFAKKEDKIPMIVFIKKGNRKPMLICNLDDAEKIVLEKLKNE